MKGVDCTQRCRYNNTKAVRGVGQKVQRSEVNDLCEERDGGR